jgi:hypothetical protein
MSTSKNEINDNKIQQMMDYLAYKVNPNGIKKINMLNTINQEMKDTTKQILKAKIHLKRRVRMGDIPDYDNLTKLENKYNVLLENYRDCVRDIQEQRELLIKGGMEVINQSKKKKNRKRRRRRKKKTTH